MKKGLFLCSENYSFNDQNILSIGIAKKIITQVKAFNDSGVDCQLINLHYAIHNKIMFFFQILFCKNLYINKISDIDFKFIDFVYIRRFFPLSRSFIFLLRYIKQHNHNCKIIYEIPTYPYDPEHKGIKGLVILWFDKIFRTKLHLYLDYIATYSIDDTIFKVPTIKIMNGIDCATIPVISAVNYSVSSIRLIAVAQFGLWHGYDRLICGLHEYYEKKPSQKVYLDLIGDGDKSVVQEYQAKIVRYKLQKYITYHGQLSGDALTNVFNQADIAVCSLANHRSLIFLSSELKSREYIARGLPIISSTKIDILPADFMYVKYVSEDDAAIDVNQIIEFYARLVKKESRHSQIAYLRRFAEQNCDMKVVLIPILTKIFE